MTIKYCEPSILEGIARQIIVKYDAALLNEPMAIPVETIMEKAYGLKLDYQYIRNNGRILGETVFEDMMVAVYERENREGYKLIPVFGRHRIDRCNTPGWPHRWTFPVYLCP